MKSELLKPCPFCGNKPELRRTETSKRWYVECAHMNCAVSPKATTDQDTKEYAIEAWNKRKSSYAQHFSHCRNRF
jgi:Lar family restriction alleviation protein